MKRNLSLLAAAGFLLSLASCSTSKVVSKIGPDDDVYYSKVQAVEPPEPKPETARSQPENANPASNNADDSYLRGYYDGSYASRLNRFYGGAWRSNYYSPYARYSYNPRISLYLGFGSPYYYDPFYYPYYGGFYNNYYSGYFYNPYYYGSYYGSMYSYNNYFPGYGYSGYWSPGNVGTTPSRTRPNREGFDRTSGLYTNGSGGSTPGSTTGRPQRSGYSPSTGDRTGDRVTSAPSSGGTQSAPSVTSRPERTTTSSQGNTSSSNSGNSTSSRPERVSQPSYTPPASNSGSSSSGSSSSSSSGSSSSGSRPTRGGE